MIAEVKVLRTTTIRDIPAMLRKLADQMENGDWGEVAKVVCCVDHPDGVQVYMWGDCTPEAAYILLNKCTAKVLEGI